MELELCFYLGGEDYDSSVYIHVLEKGLCFDNNAIQFCILKVYRGIV